MPFENSLAETKQSAKTVLRDTTIKACQMLDKKLEIYVIPNKMHFRFEI